MSGGEEADQTGSSERKFAPYGDDDGGSSFQADFITPLAGHAPSKSPHRQPGELPTLDTGRRVVADSGSLRSTSSSPTAERTDSPTSATSDEGRGQRSAQGLQRNRIVYKSRTSSSTPVATRAMGGPSTVSMRRYVSDSPVHEGVKSPSGQRSAPLDSPSTVSVAPMGRTLSAHASFPSTPPSVGRSASLRAQTTRSQTGHVHSPHAYSLRTQSPLSPQAPMYMGREAGAEQPPDEPTERQNQPEPTASPRGTHAAQDVPGSPRGAHSIHGSPRSAPPSSLGGASGSPATDVRSSPEARSATGASAECAGPAPTESADEPQAPPPLRPLSDAGDSDASAYTDNDEEPYLPGQSGSVASMTHAGQEQSTQPQEESVQGADAPREEDTDTGAADETLPGAGAPATTGTAGAAGAAGAAAAIVAAKHTAPAAGEVQDHPAAPAVSTPADGELAPPAMPQVASASSIDSALSASSVYSDDEGPLPPVSDARTAEPVYTEAQAARESTPAPAPLAPTEATPHVPPVTSPPSAAPSSAVPQTPFSGESSMSTPLQDLSDTFANAMADLGLDDAPPPVEGLENVSVAYHDPSMPVPQAPWPQAREAPAAPVAGAQPAPEPAVETAPPIETPSNPAAPAPAAAPKEGTWPAPAIRDRDMPSSPDEARPSEPAPASPPHPKIEVYGFTVWWPTSFDMSSQPHFGSIGSQQRAEAFCDWTNDLVARDTHLNMWVKQMKQTQSGTPEVLIREVRAKQWREMELAMEPPPGTPAGAAAPSEASTRSGAPMRSLQSEMDLPSNIPYPGIAERAAQAATPSMLSQTPSMPGSADPGREDAGAAARLSAAARARSLQGTSRLQGSAQALLTPFRNSTRRERVADSPSAASFATASGARVAPPSTPGSEARYGLGIPGIGHSPDPNPSPELGARTPESSLRSPAMAQSPSAYGTPITATPAATASPAPPPVDPGVRAAMRKMSDALPDADEGTILTYLGRCNGDSYRAISEYLQDQASARAESQSRRSFFSRPGRFAR